MKRTLSRRVATLGAAALLTLTLGACESGASGGSGTANVTDPELKKLVEAAQEEGTLILYGIPDEDVLQTIIEEFTELYGVNVRPVRLVSADLSQRFASEASSGAPVADAILLTYSSFFDDALRKNWLKPLSQAGIPGYPENYPADYIESDADVAIVSLVSTSMVYNTDAIAEAPTSWQALADPQYRGKISIADPVTSPANLAFWQLMREEYGDDFLGGVAANNPTWQNSAVPGTQAVAAGEDVLGHPGVQAIVDNLREEGAPIAGTVPGPTTGPEIALGLAAHAQHPNAAKLFAHYLLSEKGSSRLAEVSGAGSPYGTGLPDDYRRPTPISDTQRKQIERLLGAP